MVASENIKIAFQSIKSQKLRTVLTALIIAIGIMALVGILTAIDAVKYYFNNAFSSMGANSFTIRNAGLGIHVNSEGRRAKRFKQITYQQALEFKAAFKFPSAVSISAFATPIGVLKFKSVKSNPNISILGGDEKYLLTAGYELDYGRNFSMTDVEHGS